MEWNGIEQIEIEYNRIEQNRIEYNSRTEWKESKPNRTE
jgi:hypothetical protein